MPAKELQIENRRTYFRKAISAPDFTSERVLARDSFQFAELWLKRECPEALFYWNQARHYYSASKHLPAESSPLTSYFCFLNATKALLLVKGVPFTDAHGVSGKYDPASKRSLKNETIAFKGGGIVPSLSKHFQEKEKAEAHSLTDVLSNLPFIHRAYRYTYRSHPELFVPVKDVVYRKHPTDNYVWLSAKIEGKYADGRSLATLPKQFEVDRGFGDVCIIRAKKRIKWYARNSSKEERRQAKLRIETYHKGLRQHFVYISASPDLWYLKRTMSGATCINRYGLTLIIAAMHRLSELSRYDPKGLRLYLDGRQNWLLTEFIELAPAQFIDEIVCEMTSLEFALPGVRPK